MDNKVKEIIHPLVEGLLIILFLFTIGSGLVVSPIFGEINMIDEGQFGAWVSHMLRGEFLYKDIYAAYGPFYIYPLYFLSKIFGPSVFLVRVLYIGVNTFLAVLIARVILRELKVRYIFQIFTFLLLLIMPLYGMRQGIGLLTILLLYLVIIKTSKRWSIFAGISITSSYLISSEIGIFVTFVASVLFFTQLIIVKDIKSLLIKLFYLFLSASTIFLLFFLWSNSEGWFFSYLYSVLDDFRIYSGINLPNGKNFPNFLHLVPHSLSPVLLIKYIFSKEMLIYWEFLFYIAVFIFLFIKFVLRSTLRFDLLIFLLGMYGFLLSTILIGRSGHFVFTLPPLFILFAYFLNILFSCLMNLKWNYNKIFIVALISIILLFSIRIISIYRPHFAKVVLIPREVEKRKSSSKYLGPVAIPISQIQTIQEIQDFIDKNTHEDENVYFFNNEPMMYLLVNRGNPTRYDIPEVANTLEKRMEVLYDLKKDKTKFILDNSKAWSVDDVSNRRRLPEVTSYIEENYSLSKEGNYRIYTLKQDHKE